MSLWGPEAAGPLTPRKPEAGPDPAKPRPTEHRAGGWFGDTLLRLVSGFVGSRGIDHGVIHSEDSMLRVKGAEHGGDDVAERGDGRDANRGDKGQQQAVLHQRSALFITGELGGGGGERLGHGNFSTVSIV